MTISRQREKMRALIAKYGQSQGVVCREYALAEGRGEVPRHRNKNGLSCSEYADRLWRDGILKKWF